MLLPVDDCHCRVRELDPVGEWQLRSVGSDPEPDGPGAILPQTSDTCSFSDSGGDPRLDVGR